ncbi:hypothetical protein KP509_17G018000 [Ceratopteris richardii]|nr:hypothetical protein KP509_17G018000 [Ceratopteris richardii]
MTRERSLVARLPDAPGDFLIKKWVEKALPRSTQQKLRELLWPDATLREFEAEATRIEAARAHFGS